MHGLYPGVPVESLLVLGLADVVAVHEVVARQDPLRKVTLPRRGARVPTEVEPPRPDDGGDAVRAELGHVLGEPLLLFVFVDAHLSPVGGVDYDREFATAGFN